MHLSTFHNHNRYTTAYIKDSKGQPNKSTLTSQGWGKCGTLVVVEPLKDSTSSPFPWAVDNFEEWTKMIWGKRTMQVISNCDCDCDCD